MNSRPKIFIAGSRRLPRLNKDVKERLSKIVDRGFTVIVGDANGADKAVQQYLDERHYRDVVIFCTEGQCRNNIADWPIRAIPAANPKRKDFEYYRSKDRAMAEAADYGLMLWDAESRGTLANIVALVKRLKRVVVYIAPGKSFCTLRTADDLINMVSRYNPAALGDVKSEMEHSAEGTPAPTEELIPLF
jgi:hypothetical protein